MTLGSTELRGTELPPFFLYTLRGGIPQSLVSLPFIISPLQDGLLNVQWLGYSRPLLLKVLTSLRWTTTALFDPVAMVDVDYLFRRDTLVFCPWLWREIVGPIKWGFLKVHPVCDKLVSPLFLLNTHPRYIPILEDRISFNIEPVGSK